MSEVSAVQSGGAAAVTLGSNQSPVPVRQEAKSLLPEPDGAQLDPLSALYALVSKDGDNDKQAKISQVKAEQKNRQEAWQKYQDALAEAQRAKNKSDFWGDLGDTLGSVAKVAAVVASVATAVVSFGAATPIAALAIAGAVMSTAAFAQSEGHVLEKLGVDADVASGLGTGLQIGGAVCSLGAGLLQAGSTAATETANVATEGAKAAQATTEGAKAVQTAETLGTITRTGATVTAGVAGAASGACGIQAGEEAGNAKRAESRGEEAKLRMQLVQLLIERVIDGVKESDESDRRTLGHLRGAIEARDGAAAVTVSMGSGMQLGRA